jgi:hypothetical protein
MACLTAYVSEDTDWGVFDHAVYIFLTEMKVSSLAIRRGVYTGMMRASPLALKVETILESNPSVATKLVHANAVTGWLNRKPWLLPLPQRDLNARQRKVQQRGIETGAFVLAQILQHRASLFPDEWVTAPGCGDIPSAAAEFDGVPS